VGCFIFVDFVVDKMFYSESEWAVSRAVQFPIFGIIPDHSSPHGVPTRSFATPATHTQVPYHTHHTQAFLTKKFVQSSVSDPGSIRSVDPDSEYGSGSRRAKMNHKNGKKFEKVNVLQCWMFSFEG
jgi:hypothetical protein